MWFMEMTFHLYSFTTCPCRLLLEWFPDSICFNSNGYVGGASGHREIGVKFEFFPWKKKGEAAFIKSHSFRFLSPELALWRYFFFFSPEFQWKPENWEAYHQRITYAIFNFKKKWEPRHALLLILGQCFVIQFRWMLETLTLTRCGDRCVHPNFQVLQSNFPNQVFRDWIFLGGRASLSFKCVTKYEDSVQLGDESWVGKWVCKW